MNFYASAIIYFDFPKLQDKHLKFMIETLKKIDDIQIETKNI